KVVRHHRRRSAIEREGRHEHAAVAERDELGDARVCLRLQDRHRIPPGPELEARVRSPWALGARSPATRSSLRDREVRHRSGSGRHGLFRLLVRDRSHFVPPQAVVGALGAGAWSGGAATSSEWYSASSSRSRSIFGKQKNTSVPPSTTATIPA